MFDDEIFNSKSDFGANNTKTPKIVPKWALVLTVVVLLITMLISGIFIGVNITGVDPSVKEMSKKLPYLDEVYDAIKKYYLFDIDWDSVQDKSIQGMVNLDLFSWAYGPEEVVPPTPKIGFTSIVSLYNERVVTEVTKNSPSDTTEGAVVDVAINNFAKTIVVTDSADKAVMKIMRGDRLIALKNKTAVKYTLVSGMSAANLDTNLAKYNDLSMVFAKPDGAYYKVEITKAIMSAGNEIGVYNNMADISGNPDHSSIGYLSLREFDATRISDFLSLVKQFKDDKNAEKLIFDLRRNGGGDVQMLLEIAPIFMNAINKPILKFVDKSGKEDIAKSVHVQLGGLNNEYLGVTKSNFELVVLCDNGSASASEGFIGALRYYNPAATVVGSPTYGKGIAQQQIPIAGGKYILSITSSYFDVPVSGGSGWANYHKKRMVPDYNFYDDANIDIKYGVLYNKISDEVDVAKAIKFLLGKETL